MVAVGLALWTVNSLLALVVALTIYALGVLVLGAFTTEEIALISGRGAGGAGREQFDLA